MKDSLVIVSGGRELAYMDIGEPDWPCIMFFHGAPSNRLHPAYLEQQFLAERIRCISPDRPSYGRSSPQPHRSMLDWPADVAALADALNLKRFMVAGHSSGGPYALVCAAMLPERVSAAFTFGGVTDMAWPGAWEGYFELENQLMRIQDEEAAIAWCVEHLGADGGGFSAASGIELPEPDNRLYADEEIAHFFTLADAETFRQGVTGYAQDVVIQGRPWPFDPRSIAAPVCVVYGELDTILPPAHSQHTSDLIPGSILRVLPGHGHLSTLSELPTMASALARSLS